MTGLFSSNGDAHESELLADVDTVGSSIDRTGYSSALALLADPAAFPAFKDALTTDPQLKVDVQREPDYYAAQSKDLARVIAVVGNTVAAIMAIGAMFGALNSMFSAVAARGMEIATLRAIGFGGLPVLLSVMIEALTLSLSAASSERAGVAVLQWTHGQHPGAGFAQVVFHLTVTRGLIVTGLPGRAPWAARRLVPRPARRAAAGGRGFARRLTGSQDARRLRLEGGELRLHGRAEVGLRLPRA